jgi:hypothetical protein
VKKGKKRIHSPEPVPSASAKKTAAPKGPRVKVVPFKKACIEALHRSHYSTALNHMGKSRKAMRHITLFVNKEVKKEVNK